MSRYPHLYNPLPDSMDKTTARSRLFVPTLNSMATVVFWLGLVVFLAFYGVLVQFNQINSLQQFGVVFFDTFLELLLVTFSIIGYTHLSIASYQRLTLLKQSVRILLTTLILTPVATFLAKFIEMVLGLVLPSMQMIVFEAVINTLLAVILMILLLYYFGWQYTKILGSQQRYHQKLLHQNLHLKARITPHFFFNMLNTLQYLGETDREKSNEFLGSIVKLYRVSFVETSEISLHEELDLCEHYIKVEQYRFGDKLQVHWQVPDEDTCYDISIPSLLIQMTIEKLILATVEATTQTIDLAIKVSYQSDWVTVVFITTLPVSSQGETPMPNMDISPQHMILQQFYGETASIDTTLQAHLHTKEYIIQICYPFIVSTTS